MRHYFAYGSNMSRARLQARVGPVEDLGWSTLRGYRHVFNKRGADGTAKGNIVPASHTQVHGVLYCLAPDQLELLVGFEGGYRTLREQVLQQHGAAAIHSVTFVAVAPVTGLHPTRQYLAHYKEGMREHGLPPDYVRELLASMPRTLE